MRKEMFAMAIVGALLLGTTSSIHGTPNSSTPQGGPPPLKAGALGKNATQPLADAVFEFEESGRRNGGKAPKDAKARVDRLKQLAGPAKAEIRSFVAKLEASGEVAAFDQAAYQQAKTSAPAVVSELKSAGGAVAMLRKADAMIDEMIQDRAKIADRDTSAWLQVPGVAVLHAFGLRTTTCAAFWWVISAGNGTAHAYRSCYY